MNYSYYVVISYYCIDEKFDKLMKEISQSKCEVKEKVLTSIAELKQEANSVWQDFTGHDKED